MKSMGFLLKKLGKERVCCNWKLRLMSCMLRVLFWEVGDTLCMKTGALGRISVASLISNTGFETK